MVGFKQRNPLSFSVQTSFHLIKNNDVFKSSLFNRRRSVQKFSKDPNTICKKRKNRIKINFFLFVNKVIRNEPRFFPSFISLLFFNHGANLGYMVSLGLIFLNDPYFGRLI